MTAKEALALITSKRRLRFHLRVVYGIGGGDGRNCEERLVQVPRRCAYALLVGVPADMIVVANLNGRDLVIG